MTLEYAEMEKWTGKVAMYYQCELFSAAMTLMRSYYSHRKLERVKEEIIVTMSDHVERSQTNIWLLSQAQTLGHAPLPNDKTVLGAEARARPKSPNLLRLNPHE